MTLVTVADLLAAAETPAEPNRISAAIARAKRREPEQMSFEIEFGDELAEVTITEIRGDEWSVAAGTFPRPGVKDDARFGFNVDVFFARYPVDRITIGGDHPTAEEWAQVLELIAAPDRTDLIAALWWLHVGAPQERRETLQQLAAGKEGEHV